jgi:hypothetical protein
MYFNLAEGYVAPVEYSPKEFLKNPMTYKLNHLTQKPLTSNDFNDFKNYLHNFKVNEIVFPLSEYYRIEPVISRFGISPVNIEGILVVNLGRV